MGSSKIFQPPPPPSFLAGGDLEASKAGGFSLNGGQMPSQQNSGIGNTYSPFGNYSMNYNSPTQTTAAPKAGTMNPAIARMASSYSPFFMRY
jgi:hypothetical protein